MFRPKEEVEKDFERLGVRDIPVDTYRRFEHEWDTYHVTNNSDLSPKHATDPAQKIPKSYAMAAEASYLKFVDGLGGLESSLFKMCRKLYITIHNSKIWPDPDTYPLEPIDGIAPRQ